MRPPLPVALAVAALMLAFPARAQQAEVTRYDVEQGLPQSMVNHVVQDSLGFIWFGTGDGLARFDGSRFVEFKHDARDTTTLGNNRIWGIAALPKGDLLIGTAEGLDRYDTRTGRFTHVRTGVVPDGCWQPVHGNADRTLLYSPLSATFLVLDAQGMRAISSGHDPSYAMYCDDGGTRIRYHVWPDTLVDQDLASGKGTATLLPAMVRGGKHELLPVDAGMLILADQGAWLVTGDGRCTPLPGEAGALLHNAEGRKLAGRAPDGRLWLTMDGTGVVEVDEQWNITALHPLLPEDERPLLITSIAFDRQGNTWVGTDGKGVFRIAPQRVKFGRAMPGANLGWTPRSWFTRAFAQWGGTHVLVSFHQGGAALFDERTARLEPLDLPRIIGRPLPDNTIGRVLNDAQGNVWLKAGTEVIVLDPAGGRVIDRTDVLGGAFLVADPRGGILLAQLTGIHRASIGKGRIMLEPHAFPDLQRHLLDQADRLAMDRTGQLWSSYRNDGLRVWAADGQRPLGTGWEELGGAGYKLGEIVPIDDGRMLFATDRGLLEVDPRTRSLLRSWTRHDGLPDDLVYGVVIDEAGAWWISTNKGLCRMRGDDVRSYSTADGLQSKEFNSHAWFRSASGRIYFGGINGFNHFLPGEVRDDPDRPLVRLIRLWTNAGGIALPQDGEAASVQLPYSRNELHIELAVLEFSASERNACKWRLRGYHDAWATAAASAPIVLNNLPHGAFTLEVIGINGDGTESEVHELLRITVTRPFWASPWAIVLGVAAAIALIAWSWARAYRRRMQRRLAEAEREMKELRMRTRLARDIHDDVGSGLARMAALARSPKRNTDPDARFEKLGDISGELLENLRDVVWLNDPRHGTLDALLPRLREHAHDLFEDSGTTVTCDFPDPPPARALGGTFRRNLFLIAKEALHNARKYSGAKNVLLHWREDGDRFSFEVSDDGCGTTMATSQGSGHGTTNMRQRAEEMNAAYERVTTPGGGTTVRVHGRTSCLDG